MKRIIAIATGVAAGAIALGTATATASTQTSAPADCTSHNLVASFQTTDAGMGHRYGTIKLTNKGAHTCHISGYGGLSFVGYGNGTQIGAAADRVGGPATGFNILPDQSAVNEVSIATAQNYATSTCKPTATDGFRVYPPDETHSLYVPFKTTGCANSKVHLLTIKPYVRG